MRRSLVTLFFAIFFIIGLVLFGNQFVLMVQESIERGIPVQELMPLVSFQYDQGRIINSVTITLSSYYFNHISVV